MIGPTTQDTVYASPAPVQGAKSQTWDLARRLAWTAARPNRRDIPPDCLPVSEGGTRKERATPWLVEPVLFPIIERNSQRELGLCNATASTLRYWAWEKTGHTYGLRSIPLALRREHKRGRLERERKKPGFLFSNGQRTRTGTTTNRLPSTRERRQQQWREKQEKKRQKREVKAHQRSEKIAARRGAEPVRVVHSDKLARERAQQIVRRSSTDAPAPRGEPRTASVAVAVAVAPGYPFQEAQSPRAEHLSPEEQLAKYHAERDRQLAAARARADLWDRLDDAELDEPPD